MRSFLFFLLCATAFAGEPYVVRPNPHKQLVLDPRVIESAEHAKLTPGTIEKDPHGALFEADKPWENATNNLYPNVLWDEDEHVFKLWYKCVLADKEAIAQMDQPSTVHDVGWYLLYATSRDGIAWEKPALGLHKFNGDDRTNIVARDTPNVGVFKDSHDANPARRYKMIYDVGLGEMRARFSPDGIHWSEPVKLEGFSARHGDTHNNAWWDERLGRYIAHTKFYPGERIVARAESRDFLHWEKVGIALRSSPQEGRSKQTYCLPAFPYANGWIGYAMLYDLAHGRSVDAELAWSADSVTWQRVTPGVALIPRGAPGSGDSGCIYAPSGPPIAQDGKLLIFYGGSDAPHTGWKRSCLPHLARLRLDGWAGYEPETATATLTTRPLIVTGEPLRLSADVRPGGSLRVSVESLTSEPITADVTDGEVRWTHGDFAALKGRSLRLRFELNRAKLYAIAGVDLPPVASFTVAQDGSGDFKGADEKPILAALAKARAAGGGEIVIKAGIYQLTRSIELKDAKNITLRGQPGAVLKLPPLQHAETSADVTVGETVLPVRVQQGMAPGVRLRIMAPAGIDSFSGKTKPTFFSTLAQTEPGRLVLAKPLEFPVPAGTKIINEDAPNLLELRGACENITIESLSLDGGRTPADPPLSGHAQLCGIFAGGSYNYTQGLTGPPIRHLVVRDCVIRNCFGRGIAFYAVHDALIANCTIEDTVDEAIDLDHFVVGCQVLDNKAARSHVGVELNDANDCVVARNRFEACDTGINLWRWCKIEDLNTRNQILDNEFIGMKGNGMQLSANTTANIVRGNTVRDSGRSGIVLGGDGYEVTGNRVLDAGRAAAGKFDGITISGAKNRVLNNVIAAEKQPVTMRKPLNDGGRENTIREPAR